MNPDIPASATPRQNIRFVLDGHVHEIANVDPTRTVLQYLREDLGRVGSKEGCAEGDCGACTVVIAEIDSSGKSLRKRAINSCIQFLPTLDGKELITVESLAATDGALHPVQSAMVECHGSQCGFCTPGFVMSLYALYESNPKPTRRDVDDALAGNLCRCTGYRPIVDAAMAMYKRSRRPDDSISDAERIKLIKSLQCSDMLAISANGKQFFAPQTKSELSALCAAFPTATLLAGGTDVGLWVTKQHRELGVVIYTGNVDELSKIETTDTHIEIGAAVSLSDAMRVIAEHYPQLDELFLRFASPPIRNAGTLGGNIANASPIGDSMPALMALNSAVKVQSSESSRIVKLCDYFLAYQKTDLQVGEFVEKVLLPLPQKGEYLASYKVSKRFDQDISALCSAYRVVIENDRIADVSIAYGGMAATPQRAAACEAALLGQPWSAETIQAASLALKNDFSPISDMRSSAAYREQVAQNLLQRFFDESGSESANRVYTYGR